ncbi:MAG TPA: UbiA family prenyltransferase [Planctomycetaceae bacterium]|nr:UbiA family prenyltransferase [Planctomycetaceae bacterium]
MLAYLQLLRLPTVFTAMADIVLGFVLTHRSLEPWPQFLGLLLSSCGLYLAGMVFNDVFDRKQDALERPSRPIPSKRVPLKAAIALGTVLIIGGVAAAAMVTGPSLIIALLLVVAILGYDAVLKRTPLGPLAMGTCRFLNVMLGASDYDRWFQLWARPQLVCAIGLGVYIIGVTWFARTEAKQSNRGQLSAALVTLNAGLGVLVWLICTWPSVAPADRVLLLLALIAGSLNFRAISAIQDASPSRVQGMIKLFLLNYVTISAALVYWHTSDGMMALSTACLVVPALLLSRVIPMT